MGRILAAPHVKLTGSYKTPRECHHSNYSNLSHHCKYQLHFLSLLFSLQTVVVQQWTPQQQQQQRPQRSKHFTHFRLLLQPVKSWHCLLPDPKHFLFTDLSTPNNSKLVHLQDALQSQESTATTRPTQTSPSGSSRVPQHSI